MRNKIIKSSNHNIAFAGAGPGAPDLITLRCKTAIEEADLIIYAGSLVNPEVLKYARKACRIVDSANISLKEIVRLMKDAYSQGKNVLRLHTGDPAIYGAISEQMKELDRLKIPYKVIPGVSSVFASAAALKTELTAPGVSQTVILTRQAGRTPVPHGQEIANLARHGATMAIFLSSGDVKGLVDELIRGGYPQSTPASVVYKASWNDERIYRGTLSDIDGKLKSSGFAGRQAMIIVGDVLDKEKCQNSLLYDSGFTHGYRKAKKERNGVTECRRNGDFKGKVAIYAITEEGAKTAIKLSSSIKGSKVFLPVRQEAKSIKLSGTEFFGEGEFDEILARTWNKFDGHIFIMATGIVVRKISPLIGSKTSDPAVVVCDQRGNYAISLLSGHIGGANRLANFAAEILGGQAVLTTATDVQNMMAFDEMASIEGWQVANPKMIKTLNSMLIAGKRIGLIIPKKTYRKYYSSSRNLFHLSKYSANTLKDYQGIVSLQRNIKTIGKPVLLLKKKTS